VITSLAMFGIPPVFSTEVKADSHFALVLDRLSVRILKCKTFRFYETLRDTSQGQNSHAQTKTPK
jgi:hypothetical protein